jgi:hypothetical protein
MRIAPLAWAVGLLVHASPAALAELPPWAYGEQQRQAPVVVGLVVISASGGTEEVALRCRLIQVIRQPPNGQLRAGQTLVLRYPVPPSRQPAMVGPSPLPVLRPGQKATAWLSPIPGQLATFRPAAGGKSFGPSMEEAVEPGAP